MKIEYLDVVFKVANTYLPSRWLQDPAMFRGSICSWFPVRWSTFRHGNRPRFNILSPVILLKDKSSTWNKWIMSGFFIVTIYLGTSAFNCIIIAQYSSKLTSNFLKSSAWISKLWRLFSDSSNSLSAGNLPKGSKI